MRNVQESRHTPVSEPRPPLDQFIIRFDDIDLRLAAESTSLRLKESPSEVARLVLTVKL
jgi:hypothetical protein